jgi:hypothetical protein
MEAKEMPAGGTIDNGDELMIGAATVGVICVGAALIEAALIPGMVIRVAAMLAPKALSKLGNAVEPIFRGAVRGTYKLGQKARHIMAEEEGRFATSSPTRMPRIRRRNRTLNIHR